MRAHGIPRPGKSKRARIYARDRYRCQLCGTDQAEIGIDHKVKRADGGTNDDANLWVLCRPCHDTKDGMGPRRRGYGCR